MDKDKAVSLLTHFTEIKKRLIRISIIVISSTIVSFIFYQPISKFVQKPALDALIKISPDIPATLVFLDVFEGWSAIARLSVLVGFSISFPYIMFELVMFLRPGLTKSERRYIYSLIPGGTLLFFLGVAFAYYILIPPAVYFLFSFGSDIATPTPRIGSYIALMSSLVFWMGVIFEIPIIMFLLAKAGLLKSSWVSKNRVWNILFGFVLGAIITPTFDPVTQTLAALPAIFLFELGLLLVKITERSRKK
tara:strand:+ start:479 stop:1225 length:747 start_codon:yes stop_codon:yes gene_type:complete